MTAKIIDGKKIADAALKKIALEVRALEKKTGARPGLGVVLVGEDPASVIYVAKKEAACKRVGIFFKRVCLPKNAHEESVLNEVRDLNKDDEISGIIVQFPLPRQVNAARVLQEIDARKDVDGFHPLNAGKIAISLQGFAPATPKGVMRLLESIRVRLEGKECVVVGCSNIVGKPLGLMLVNKNATVTFCHKYTRNLARHTREADVLITAVGKPGLIKANMVKKGAIVIDVGTTRVGKKIVGDVDFARVKEKASFITPVPGGVGPVTVAALLENTLQAFKEQRDSK